MPNAQEKNSTVVVQDPHSLKVLGLKEPCTKKEIQIAYRRLSKSWHPDRAGNEEQRQVFTTRFQQINNAKRKLLGEDAELHQLQQQHQYEAELGEWQRRCAVFRNWQENNFRNQQPNNTNQWTRMNEEGNGCTEAARKVFAEAAKKVGEKEARKLAEAEAAGVAKAAGEEEARKVVEANARKLAEAKKEVARKIAEAEAAQLAKEEEARKLAEAEAAKLAKEADARKLAKEGEARKIAEVEARKLAKEEEARKLAEAEAKKLAEVEARKLAKEGEARRLAEAEAKKLAEAEARKLAKEGEARRLAKEEKARKLAKEAEAKKVANEEEARKIAEVEARKLAMEEEARKLAEVEAAKLAEEEADATVSRATRQFGDELDAEILPNSGADKECALASVQKAYSARKAAMEHARQLRADNEAYEERLAGSRKESRKRQLELAPPLLHLSKLMLDILCDKVVPQRLSFSFKLDEGFKVLEDTRLSDLSNRIETYVSVIFVNDESETDGLFDYDDVFSSTENLFFSKFDSRERNSIQLAVDHDHAIMLSIHVKAPSKNKHHSKALCGLIFQKMKSPAVGIFINYIATDGGNFTLDMGRQCDHQPWERRGLAAALLHLASEISFLWTTSRCVYLQCPESKLVTYYKFGFEEVTNPNLITAIYSATDVKRNPQLKTMSIEESPNTSKAATPSASPRRGRRQCCHDRAWLGKPHDYLTDFDKTLLKDFDVYPSGLERDIYYVRCGLCGVAKKSDHYTVLESDSFYEFIKTHNIICKKVTTQQHYERSQLELQVMITPIAISYIKQANRRLWINNYIDIIRDNACPDGCGVVGPEDDEIESPDTMSSKRQQNCSTATTTAIQRQSSRLGNVRIVELRSKDAPKKKITYQLKQFAKIMMDNNKKWWGIYSDGRKVQIEEEFVEENCKPFFITRCRINPERTYKVMVGAPKVMPLTSLARDEDFTIIPVYQQLFRDTCAMSAIASAMRFFNDQKAHQLVAKNINSSQKAYNRFLFAETVIMNGKLKYVTRKFKERQLNIIEDLSCFPTLVRLEGHDGSTSHAVATAGKWLFDANLPTAEKISLPLLDWCCSTDAEKTKFSHVSHALRFFKFKPRPEWNLCDGCRENKQCLIKL